MEDTEGKVRQRNEKKEEEKWGRSQGVCAMGAAGPHGVPNGICET